MIRQAIACTCLALAAPAAAGPATRPATTRPARLDPALRSAWGRYCTSWAGGNLRQRSRADQQLVQAVLDADPNDVAPLRDVMRREYRKLADPPRADDFHLGRVASRLAVAWTRVPAGEQLSAVQLARHKKQSCEKTVHWAVVALEHFAGNIDDRYVTMYKSFLPGTAVSMLSLIPSRIRWCSRPGDVAGRLRAVRSPLRALADADPAAAALTRRKIDAHYQKLAGMDELQAAKQAVRKLLAGFRAAYNARDGKAFAACWPEGHPATASLARQTLADRIEATHWKITRFEPIYVMARDGKAVALVISRYAAKDGTPGPQRLQQFPARRTKAGAWKLN